MILEQDTPRGRRPEDADWVTDPDVSTRLLDELTRDRLEEQALEMEREASAGRSPADVQAEQLRTARQELQEAREEREEFRAALDDARLRGPQLGLAEVPYDAADPRQDRYADLLIQYLVRPGYAAVRTEEPEPQHYIYYVQVDWSRLRAMAQRR
jgi:hypothetical protein